MKRLYADVEYLGSVYLDAELIENNWYCEDLCGVVHPFTVQYQVRPVNMPQVLRRYSPSWSGPYVPFQPKEGKNW